MDENSSLVGNRVGNHEGRVNNAASPAETRLAVGGQPHGNLAGELIQYKRRQVPDPERAVWVVDPEWDVPSMDARKDRVRLIVFCAKHFGNLGKCVKPHGQKNARPRKFPYHPAAVYSSAPEPIFG